MFNIFEKRLLKTFKRSPIIEFNEKSKFIIFSDAHRGDGTWADDFANNYYLLLHALKYYYDSGFTLIELGDNNELWKNKSFKDIFEAHTYIYEIIQDFYEDKRYYMIFGNHDIEFKYKRRVVKNLYYYYKKSINDYLPFLKGIRPTESLILFNKNEDLRIFLIHGHQGDFFGDYFWHLGRFLVRYIIKPLQLLGVKDPTSPAKNFEKRKKVEKRLIKWISKNNQILICGHTHRPVIPKLGDPPYFNSGSCVFPRAITGLEIIGNLITLVKWWLKPDKEGILKITKEVLEGPKDLRLYKV
ncbi:MAG TPA: metallophosphoesterase family protein [Spirochaetota bacterium]|nr:metallophosphoesterase family protein [Spirochaetota bacterium]HOM38399.1 metallophosphoesterase family protein [Spirochaetota bacterium]HPQ48383.1 metallophosphoesterase family protein [Spirochaetota bacterium]